MRYRHVQRLRVPQSRILLVLAAFLALLGCAHETSVGVAPTAAPTASITYFHASPTSPSPWGQIRFASSMRYLDALHLITDLGLQPLSYCDGPGIPDVEWHPVSQMDMFAQYFRLPVHATRFAAPNWLSRLSTAPGVLEIDDGLYTHCQNIRGVLTPLPGVAYFLSEDTPPVLLQVVSSATTYEEAMLDISTLGLALAVPCSSSPTAGSRPIKSALLQGRSSCSSRRRSLPQRIGRINS